MTRSGIATTSSAFLYSGFFLKREEFSSVEASSVCRVGSQCTVLRPIAMPRDLVFRGGLNRCSPLYACSNSGSEGRLVMMAVDVAVESLKGDVVMSQVSL